MERQPLKSITKSWFNSTRKMEMNSETLKLRNAEAKINKRKEKVNNVISSKRKKTMEEDELRGFIGEEQWEKVTQLKTLIKKIEEGTIFCEESKRISKNELLETLEEIEGELATFDPIVEDEVIKYFSPKMLGYFIKMLPEKAGENFEEVYYPLSFIDCLLYLDENIKALLYDHELRKELITKIDNLKEANSRYCDLSVDILEAIYSYYKDNYYS